MWFARHSSTSFFDLCSRLNIFHIFHLYILYSPYLSHYFPTWEWKVAVSCHQVLKTAFGKLFLCRMPLRLSGMTPVTSRYNTITINPINLNHVRGKCEVSEGVVVFQFLMIARVTTTNTTSTVDNASSDKRVTGERRTTISSHESPWETSSKQKGFYVT